MFTSHHTYVALFTCRRSAWSSGCCRSPSLRLRRTRRSSRLSPLIRPMGTSARTSPSPLTAGQPTTTCRTLKDPGLARMGIHSLGYASVFLVIARAHIVALVAHCLPCLFHVVIIIEDEKGFEINTQKPLLFKHNISWTLNYCMLVFTWRVDALFGSVSMNLLQRHVIAPDFMMLIRFQNKVLKMATAYYFTGDDAYAELVARRIRAFFLDEETGMLPSLLYAQLKPGQSDVGAPTVHCQPSTLCTWNLH
jgi:hypothetical protein